MLNHTQVVLIMILLGVAGLTAWWFAFRSWSAPVPLDDDSPPLRPIDYTSYRGYWD